MTRFDEFYKITIGMPADNAPSFRYRLVDQFGRVSDHQYGTIEPAEVGSVAQYDQKFVSHQLALWLAERFHGTTDGSNGFAEAKAFIHIGTRLKPLQDFVAGKLRGLSIASGVMLVKPRPESRPQLEEIYGFQPDRIHQYAEDICEAINACRHGFRRDVFAKLVNKWNHMIVDYKEPVGLRARATAYVQNFADVNLLEIDSLTVEDNDGLTIFMIGDSRIAISNQHVRVKWMAMGSSKTARKESTALPLLLEALEAELHQKEVREETENDAIPHSNLQSKMALMVQGLTNVQIKRQCVKTAPSETKVFRITNGDGIEFNLSLHDGVFGAYAEMAWIAFNTEYLIRCHGYTGLPKFIDNCEKVIGRFE
jgi:hypothetical protein